MAVRPRISTQAKWAVGDAYFYDRFERGRVGAACLGAYVSAGGGEVFTTGTCPLFSTERVKRHIRS